MLSPPVGTIDVESLTSRKSKKNPGSLHFWT